MRPQTTSVLPELPSEVVKAIEGKDDGTASTLLGIYRTQLGERRTGFADLRSHLANERTHLSYVRTAITLISFGITVNQFAAFLQKQGTFGPGFGTKHLLRNSRDVGTAMVILGVALVVWSMYRYWYASRDIVQERLRPLDGAAYMLTVFLLLLGGLAAVWLFLF